MHQNRLCAQLYRYKFGQSCGVSVKSFNAFAGNGFTFTIGGSNVDCTIISDIDLGIGFFLQARIFFPPGPIIAPIFSTGTLMMVMRGSMRFQVQVVVLRNESRASHPECDGGHPWPVPERLSMISGVIPLILISICRAVIPLR